MKHSQAEPQPSPIAEQVDGTAGSRHSPPADSPTGRTYAHSSAHVAPHNQCQPPTSRSLLAIWPERRAAPLGHWVLSPAGLRHPAARLCLALGVPGARVTYCRYRTASAAQTLV